MDSRKIFTARSQLMTHAGGRSLCRCASCIDARAVLDEAEAEQRRKLAEVGEAFVAEVRAERFGGRR